MPCLEFNTIGKGVQYKCKYQKLRCYNGVKLAHCFTFFVFSFPEKLGGGQGAAALEAVRGCRNWIPSVCGVEGMFLPLFGKEIAQGTCLMPK